MTSEAWILYLGAYLVGAVPTAYILVRKITGQDIRALGDGNVGAKNTFGSVSRWLGILVAGIDISKGWAVINTARLFDFSEGAVLLTGAAVVLGHDFSIILNFRGGQGMAASVGIFLALFPQITLWAFLIFLVSLALIKYWDLSCFLGLSLLVFLVWYNGRQTQEFLFVILLLPWIAIKKMVQNWQKKRLAV